MEALRSLERLLLPNACVACDRWIGPTDPDALICPICRGRFRPVLGGCRRCGQLLPLVGSCRFCAAWPAALGWARSAVWLHREAREMVHHLKYEGYGHLASLAARIVARQLPRPTGATLVPIPLSVRRQRTRGYNQAALIARELGQLWNLPAREELLTRERDTGSQTALTPQERVANVAGAFAAPCPAEGAMILVDDVLTTGATLGAAATALAAGGGQPVGALTFARALPFELRLN